MRARTSSRMSASVVPGSVRQSISITASPGMTLYLMPAWTTSGLIVSRRRARRARAYIGSHSAHGGVGAARVVAADRADQRRGLRRQATATTIEERRIGAVSRGSPGEARRRMASAARTAALSSRGIEPWPHVPWTEMR